MLFNILLPVSVSLHYFFLLPISFSDLFILMILRYWFCSWHFRFEVAIGKHQLCWGFSRGLMWCSTKLRKNTSNSFLQSFLSTIAVCIVLAMFFINRSACPFTFGSLSVIFRTTNPDLAAYSCRERNGGPLSAVTSDGYPNSENK